MSIDVTRTKSLSDRVAAEVRAEMGRRQVSGRELARRLGRSPNWVSLKVSGTQRLDLDEIALIAEALGVTVVDLFPQRDRVVTTGYDPTTESVDAPTVSRDLSHGTVRPTGGRPPGRSDRQRPPSGPRRTSRVPGTLAA